MTPPIAKSHTPGAGYGVRMVSTPPAPDYALEHRLAGPDGVASLAGVDEVGRGACAGPVVVGAAVTDGSPPPPGLTDSKRLTRRQRVAMAAELESWVVDHAFGHAGPAEIDELGMTAALRLAARRALAGLRTPPGQVVLDGVHDYLGAPWRVTTQAKADLSCVSVAAASVLAKVHRDTRMAALAQEHPGYAFEESAGYPSPRHRHALAEHGPTPHHRMSWAYLDGLPQWRHLRRARPAAPGQTPLF
jgi:ribonuclease HII